VRHPLYDVIILCMMSFVNSILMLFAILKINIVFKLAIAKNYPKIINNYEYILIIQKQCILMVNIR